MPVSKPPARFHRSALLAAATILLIVPAGCKKGARAADSASRPGASASISSEPSPAIPEAKKLDTYGAFSALGYRAEWVGYPVMPRGRKVQFFDAFDDILVVQESGNLITVMDAATGSNRWSLDPSTRLTKFVGNVRDESGNILACAENEVFVIDPVSGVINKRQRLARIVNTPPAIVGDILVFGCPTGEALAHSLTSGYKRWGYMLDGAITAPPVRVNESVAVVSQGGELVMLEAREGRATGRGELFGGLVNEPVVEGSRVFFAGLDQSIWAFDQHGYQPVWRVRLDQPLRSQPTVIDGRVYVSIPAEGLACFEASNGTRVWTTPGIDGHVVARRGDRLILWNGKEAMALDPARGDVIERIVLPGIDRLVSDKPVDGNLYSYTLKGEVRKFSPKK